MKTILLTWYGMTDLKASLDLEKTPGPILNVVQNGCYTDVVVLCYTNKEKTDLQGNNFNEDLILAKRALSVDNINEVNNFINKYSNTEIAHNNYQKWLLDKVENKNVNFSFNSVNLKHLNDTDGIYDIVNKVMDGVDKWNVDKEVHLFLSPGTPVMAFVWALVSMKYPNLNKKLLASSIVGKNAEFVELPQEWVAWRNINEFDIVFNLFGEQRMPGYLSINQFKSKKHVFISSPNYPANIMSNFLEKSEFDEIVVDPYDPSDIKNKITRYLKEVDPTHKIGFNLTGGTKLMYAGALAACKDCDATPFYFNIEDNSVMYLNNFEKSNIKNIVSVETFFKLNGDDLTINKQDKRTIDNNINKRESLTKYIFEIRRKISKKYNQMIIKFEENSFFEIEIEQLTIRYNKENKGTRLIYQNDEYSFSSKIDFEKYITGGWFEEYIYLSLKHLEARGIIFDLRINLELSLKNPNIKNISFANLDNLTGKSYQELDITFTDGKKLYIVECKAGKIKTEHIEKLKNITLHYGGISSIGILAGCFKIDNEIIQKKIGDNRNIIFVDSGYAKKIDELVRH